MVDQAPAQHYTGIHPVYTTTEYVSRLYSAIDNIDKYSVAFQAYVGRRAAALDHLCHEKLLKERGDETLKNKSCPFSYCSRVSRKRADTLLN